MSFLDVLKTAAAVIASLGGGGAIVWGLSGYLGRIWAERALEGQRHEYSRLNIAFQSQLNMAARRLQVELDALRLVHRLRTQEEFARLAGLWKRMANLQNYYSAFAQEGLRVASDDVEARKRWDMTVRQEFESHLNNAQMFLAEEALFIPKPICDLAEVALKSALEERFNSASFSPYLDSGGTVVPISSPELRQAVTEMQKEYFTARAASFKRFHKAMEELETLMRNHIGGSPMPVPEISTP